MKQELNGYHLLIQGFRHVQYPDPSSIIDKLRFSVPNLQVQLVKASMIADIEHIVFAVRNAINAYNSSRMKSKSLGIELLLYLSGQRQILRAIRQMGVSSNDDSVVVVGIGESSSSIEQLESRIISVINGEADDYVIEINSLTKAVSLQKTYTITGKEVQAAKALAGEEIDALKRLIIERSALLLVEG